MSGSKSSSSNKTQTTDQRTTNTLNAGLQGDISDAFVAAGNYGDTNLSSQAFTDNSDHSTRLEMSDNSDRSVTDNSDNSSNWYDYSDRSFTDSSDNSMTVEMSDSSDRSITDNSDNSYRSDWADYSDNSMTVSMSDDSDRSVTDNSDHSVYTDNRVNTVTDGGAFELIGSLGGRLFDTLGQGQAEALKLAGEAVNKSLDSSQLLAQQSLQNAMQIKSGQVVTEPQTQNVRALTDAGFKLGAIAAAVYIGSKFLK